MFCKQCNKGILIRQYRVNLTYFNSLELAENQQEYLKEKYADEKISLYELLICNNCNYIKETVLERKEV